MEDQVVLESVEQDTPVENWTDQQLEEASNVVSGEDVPEQQVETQDVAAEPVKESATPAQPQPTQPDKVLELAKQIEGLQKLTARRETEYGEMKKRLELLDRLEAQKKAEQPEGEFELDYADPNQIKAKMQEIARQEREAAESSRIQQQQFLDNRKALINGKFPEFDQYVPEIGSLIIKLLGDDAPGIHDAVTELKSNPYKEDPLTLMFASEAVKANRKVAEMEKQLATMRDSKGGLLKKIERAAQIRPTVTGNQGGTTKQGLSGLGDRAVEHMTDDELNRQLQHLMKQGQ